MSRIALMLEVLVDGVDEIGDALIEGDWWAVVQGNGIVGGGLRGLFVAVNGDGCEGTHGSHVEGDGY